MSCACGNPELATNGKRLRNVCKDCYNAAQRKHYHANHDRSLEVRKALYRKHAPKRRAESVKYNKDNPERHALLEWFRRKGIPAIALKTEDLDALIAMKKALKQ